MRLHGAIQTSVFNRLLCACDWVGRSTQNVVTRILVNFRRSGVADSTGPAFKTVKRKTPSLLRPASFGLGPERPLLEITSDLLLRSTLFHVLLGLCPVHKREWDFFPLMPFRAEVAHELSLHLMLADHFLRTILEDQVFEWAGA